MPMVIASSETCVLVVDRERPLSDLIRAANLDWADSEVTEEHFPSAPGPRAVVIELVEFGPEQNWIVMQDELKRVRKRGATLRELLAYGAKRPERQLQSPVLALGSPWLKPLQRLPDNHPLKRRIKFSDRTEFPVLTGDAEKSTRHLSRRGTYGWLNYRFAAVQL